MAKEEKVPAVEVSYKELRAAVNALNESKLAEPIKIVGIQKDIILKNFKDVVNSIPDNAEGKFPGPPEVLKFYNDLLDAEEEFAKKNTPPPEQKKEEKEKKTEGTAKGESPEEKKEKTSTGEKKEGIGYMARNLIKTTSLSNQEIFEKIKEKFPNGNTKISNISWYRQMIKKGKFSNE